jgi:flagellar protein FlgJ
VDYAFNDIGGLQSINRLAKKDRGEAISQVARQFESFFVAQMMKGMRAANDVLAADGLLQTNEMQFRQQMLDDQLGLSLSQGRGLGLAEVFERSLKSQFGIEDGAKPRGDMDRTGDIEARRIDKALPAETLPALQADRALIPPLHEVPSVPPVQGSAQAIAQPELPPIVSSALSVLQPAVKHAREAFDAVKAKFEGKEGFVEALAPLARKAAEKLGVDHRVLIAQAALETGWGQSILGDSAGRSSFNLFNIKAGSFWSGNSVGVNTLEFRDGIPRPERARFRAYGSFEESFSDYAELLLGNGRYKEAITKAGDAASFVHGLARAGYATDPNYAPKILRLLRDPAIAGAQ